MTRHDRIGGALALSALGDAWGLPSEGRALAGEVCPVAEGLPASETFRESEPNEWNVWADFEQTRGWRGLVSDDTAIKVALVEPWLTASDDRSEAGFRAWLLANRPEGMAGRLADRLEEAWRIAEGRPGESGFFRPGLPVHWGPFIYGPLALLETSPEAAFGRFRDFCALDQGYGRDCAGAFAAWVVGGSDAMLQAVAGSAVGEAFREAQALGVAARGRGLVEFGRRAQGSIFASDRVDLAHPLRPFDPLLQGMMMVACAAFGDEDPILTLRAAAQGPGDSDTIAAHLGLVLGASFGYEALRARVEFRDDYAEVERYVDRFFGVSLAARVAGYQTR